jgi:hypothetical protein
VAALGSPAAERAFRPLLRRWVLAAPPERRQLERQLVDFGRRFPDDPLARMARAVRAWNALEAGDLRRARQMAVALRDGDRGVAHDLATVVLGAVERRSGNYRAAANLLRPLLHKMLDGFATALLNEELVYAAVGAKRWNVAVYAMEVWQREAETGSEGAITDRVRQLLPRVPKRALWQALESRRTRLESRREMAKLLARQLAVIAARDQDSTLAAALLQSYGALLGPYGETVARLAVGSAEARVVARTVGLLISVGHPSQRRRSTEVIAGMSFGLELPGSGARLVTRDGGADDASVVRGMTELAGEGAAVVVAGLDPRHSHAAAAFAREHSLPTLLLTAPTGATAPSPVVFLMGEDPARTAPILVNALRSAGASRIAGFGPPLRAAESLGILDRRCTVLDTADELEKLGVDGLLVYDGAFCAPEAAQAAIDLDAPLALGLGVEAPPALPRIVRALAAGAFPIDPRRPDPRLAPWISARGEAPSWWNALGRDAAVLAWDAVEDLEEAGTERVKVRERRVEAQSALSAARVSLWTSDAPGFTVGQRLERRIELRREGGREGR